MAFGAGILSFLSPCVLPVIPSYVCLITGMGLKELTSGADRAAVMRATALNSLLFILGFSSVFMALGAGATVAGRALFEYREVFRIGGGILVILFGLFIMGLIKTDFLEMEKRIRLPFKPGGTLGAFLIGATFGAAWVPCVGPILGSILVLASNQSTFTSGILLLALYSLGLGIPFFISSLLLNAFLATYSKASRYLGAVTLISGLLLILMGILLLTGNFTALSSALSY